MTTFGYNRDDWKAVVLLALFCLFVYLVVTYS
jgi:hypothetical protein